jgi:hypothetical protein
MMHFVSPAIKLASERPGSGFRCIPGSAGSGPLLRWLILAARADGCGCDGNGQKSGGRSVGSIGELLIQGRASGAHGVTPSVLTTAVSFCR